MSPEALQAALLQAVETKAADDLASAQKYAATLRQLLAKGMKTPEPEVQP